MSEEIQEKRNETSRKGYFADYRRRRRSTEVQPRVVQPNEVGELDGTWTCSETRVANAMPCIEATRLNDSNHFR